MRAHAVVHGADARAIGRANGISADRSGSVNVSTSAPAARSPRWIASTSAANDRDVEARAQHVVRAGEHRGEIGSHRHRARELPLRDLARRRAARGKVRVEESGPRPGVTGGRRSARRNDQPCIRPCSSRSRSPSVELSPIAT
jgi:hypothetical protein